MSASSAAGPRSALMACVRGDRVGEDTLELSWLSGSILGLKLTSLSELLEIDHDAGRDIHDEIMSVLTHSDARIRCCIGDTVSRYDWPHLSSPLHGDGALPAPPVGC